MDKDDMIDIILYDEKDSERIKFARGIFRVDQGEFIEQIREMDDAELVHEIIKHPEMGEFVFPFVKDLSAFYDEVKEYYVPDREVLDDNEVQLNQWVPIVLREMKRYIMQVGYKDFDEYEEARYKKIEYDNLRRELDDMISLGYSPEDVIDFCEAKGYNFNHLYDATSLKYAYENNGIEYSIDDITRAIETNIEAKKEEILMEAEEEEYSDYLDSLETYKMGDNPEIDNKINECLKQGYLPSYIDTILEDYGYTLSPEDLKEMYYKCGFEYDIETGAARKIEDKESFKAGDGDFISPEIEAGIMDWYIEAGQPLPKREKELASLEAKLRETKCKIAEMKSEDYSIDSSEYEQLIDLVNLEDLLEYEIAQTVELYKKQEEASALTSQLKEIEFKISEIKKEIYSTGSSELDPEYQELFDLYDKREELENSIMKLKEEIASIVDMKSYHKSLIELENKEKELSALEAEEKKISEAEALIDRATTKEGQDIGEE